MLPIFVINVGMNVGWASTNIISTVIWQEQPSYQVF
jgi:hypothetical protein